MHLSYTTKYTKNDLRLSTSFQAILAVFADFTINLSTVLLLFTKA